ncbi:MAG: PAS domain-containing protein [Acidobacteria bacterium]|nr:PAS domain-containing protein [Acidobacteriota bacterium]
MKPGKKGTKKRVAAGQPAPRSDEPALIVGIGASAGGLEAFTDMLRQVPLKTGIACVLVQHLDPRHVSLLTQLLSRESELPVLEIKDGMAVTRDTVYVIPRNATVTIDNRLLRLSPRDPARAQHMSIDIFLRSLAADQGMRSAGVILSGNASDGVLGIKAIKAAGGITFAQDPDAAKNPEMPRHAIASGAVDFVGTPGEIVRELVRLARHSAVEPVHPGEEGGSDVQSAVFNRILVLLRNATGVDFSNYKTSTIRRRISRRMMLRRTESLQRYLGLLRSEPAEIGSLYEDILINVTEFFRDPDVFETLAKTIFPRIAFEKKLARNRQIRIWVPGCSTGEEAYSIVIALLEYLGDRANDAEIQMFATDVSESALEKARTGIYPDSIAHSLSADRLRRFFVRLDSGYQIHQRVRELCVFARHNLLRDPPFSKMDLISCRNVLIYLGPPLQQKIIPTFHYALKSGGYLLLGSSETIGSFSNLFFLMDKNHKIYERRPTPTRPLLELAAIHDVFERPQTTKKIQAWSETDVQKEADRLVLNKYSPPGIIVNESLDIVQFRGHTGPYFEPTAGTASLNLRRMAREGLLAEIKNAVARARSENTAVKRQGLRISHAEGFHHFDLEVIPMRRNGRERRFLVLFVPVATPPAEHRKPEKPSRRNRSAVERENERLRSELQETRDYLQSLIEEHEAAQEELRSAGEEIQSSNEELQSTNEELETAKEELQSTNEELNTVNEELQNRNLQLTQIGNDLLNLLANVSMPIVILGNDLRIRRFTPAAEKVLNLLPSDVGRPFGDINFGIGAPGLEERLRDVIDTLASQMLDVQDSHGRHFSLRIRPYRTEENNINGVVMVFVDLDPDLRALNEPWKVRLLGGGSEAAVRPPGTEPRDDELRRLGAAILQTQEEERRRVAHELHDEFNQRLALIELNLQRLERGPGAKEQSNDVAAIRKLVSGLSDEIRRIAYRLHPTILDDLGLVAALQTHCEEFSGREGIRVKFTHRNVPASLPHDVSLCLYRIVQEGLRNVAKHSGARQAIVTLTGQDSGLRLTLKDAGVGFDPEAVHGRGLGLIGMQERVQLLGGGLHLNTTPGAGTEIAVELPATNQAAGGNGGQSS